MIIEKKLLLHPANEHPAEPPPQHIARLHNLSTIVIKK
jgi:hypothetical protein